MMAWSARSRADAGRHLIAAALVAILFGGHLLSGGFARADGALLAATLCALAAVVVLALRDSAAVLHSKALLALGACLSVVLAVALYQVLWPGYDHEYALLALFRILGLAAGFVLGAVIGFSGRRLAVFRVWLCGAMLIFGLLAFVHFVLQLDALIPPAPFMAAGRLSFTLLSANSAALELAISLVMAGAIVLSELGEATDRQGRPSGASRLTWLALAAAAISFIDLGLTRSRSGIFLTAAAALIGLLVFGAKSRRAILYRSLPIGLFALAVMVMASASRLGAANDDFGQRIQIYRAHLGSALDRPLLGHGFGNFQAVNRAVTTPENFGALYNINALHNVYLQWMEQAGWVATGAMALCVALILWRVGREATRGRRASVYWLRASLLAALIAFGQGLIDLGFEHYSIALMLGVILGGSVGLSIRREWPA